MRWCFFIFFLAGCGGTIAPVNLNLAQDALSQTMDAWKDGKPPEALLDESPPVTVTEIEWKQGAKLLDYEIIEDEKRVDGNLVADVKIKLKTPDGKAMEKTACYVVSTHPNVSVFRNMLRR